MAVLKQGSSGPDVMQLQQKLTDLGFDPNGVDGNFGFGTKTAVIAFQKSNGLQADGVVGPNTLAALNGAVGGNSSVAVTSASSSKLNVAALRGLIPDTVLSQVPTAASEFSITTNLRLAHFLAQCALESMNFTAVAENVNYSAQRLLQVFPKYFENVDVNTYARNPQKIGSRVYANRMGNGDEASGDGFRYRGRGYVQLTGKNNYRSFSTFVGEDCVADPDLVATKYPLASAAFYFNSNKIWTICDRGANDATVTSVTKAVNGGTHGLAERLQNFRTFNQALGRGD
jgi:putative chitinase